MLRTFLLAMALGSGVAMLLAETGPHAWPTPLDHRVSLAMAPPQQASRTVVIPAQTEAKIQLLSGIHSKVSHVGDLVTAQLLQPVYVGGEVALPAGSLIGGHITRIRPAGRMRRPAEMVLRFERITLPDGQKQPLSAVLEALDPPARTQTRVDSEGFLKGTRSISWTRIAGGMAGLGAFGAIQGSLAGAAALAATVPIGGSALLGYSFLWPKGNEVHVPPDTAMRIRLRNSLTVRLAW